MEMDMGILIKINAIKSPRTRNPIIQNPLN